MAQTNLAFVNPQGGIQVKANTTYSSNNVPTQAEVVLLTRGVRILDDMGASTPLRGVRMLVVSTGLSAPVAPLTNVPVVWVEGQLMAFSAGFAYTFLDDGIVMYGTKVII